MKKLFALMLALVMLFSVSALAEKARVDGQIIMVKTDDYDYTNKTVILHSNDVHGAIDGYACMAQLKKDLTARGADVIVVDAGDFTQGTPYVSLSKGHVAIELMNAAGYDLVTLGNHEFDFGCDQMMANLKDANFKSICANVYDLESGNLILDATALTQSDSGLKIGFFGMETPETATKINPGLIKNIRFSTFGDLYAAAQTAVDSLSEADIVIGLCHLGIDDESAANGYRSIDLMANVKGIDFIIDGHSHTVMTSGPNNEPIQSTGTRFAYIGVIVIDNDTKAIVDNYLLPTSYLAKDSEVEAMASAITADVDEKYGSAFATTEVLLNGARSPGNRTEETNLGDLITDAMVWSVVKEGGIEQVEPNAVVGITNGGGIRATIEAGDISMMDINTVLPFGNTVAVVYVTGEELLEAMEASTFLAPAAVGGYPQTSGITWTLDTTVPYDQGALYSLNGKDTTYYAPASIKRVTITSINGEPFDPKATYAVVTNNFCAAGGDTYNVFNRAYEEGAGFDTNIPMDEAVMNYITDVLQGKITAEAYGEPAGRETQIK